MESDAAYNAKSTVGSKEEVGTIIADTNCSRG